MLHEFLTKNKEVNMKLEQYIGPFTANQVIFNKSNVNYLQLGIEHPYSIPISELEDIENENDWPIIVAINSSTPGIITQKDFIISDKDILELKPNGLSNITVIIKENINNPYLIINAAYEDAT